MNGILPALGAKLSLNYRIDTNKRLGAEGTFTYYVIKIIEFFDPPLPCHHLVREKKCKKGAEKCKKEAETCKKEAETCKKRQKGAKRMQLTNVS